MSGHNITGLLELIAGTLDVPGSELTDDTGFGTHPGWTSMKHIELIVAIEESYGVELSHREIRDMANVQAITKTLQAKGVLIS